MFKRKESKTTKPCLFNPYEPCVCGLRDPGKLDGLRQRHRLTDVHMYLSGGPNSDRYDQELREICPRFSSNPSGKIIQVDEEQKAYEYIHRGWVDSEVSYPILERNIPTDRLLIKFLRWLERVI